VRLSKCIPLLRKCGNTFFTAGGALVDVSLTTGDGFCIRAAAWVFALSALGLGQQRVNLLD
jgi:hypothetical protein